ncbi:UNVERIFIED_ORG: hypothetical protein J2X79_002974 [Arthrobacter globiformis]|nr:hypothetical protein [Arthrobacter globiformis]
MSTSTEERGPSVAEGRWTKAGVLVAVVTLGASYYFAAADHDWWPFTAADSQGATSTNDKCPDTLMTQAGDSVDRLRPPTDLTIKWEASPSLPDRAAATVKWRINDDRTASGLIEIAGRYGVQFDDDIPYRLDGRPLPSQGLCGHWLRQYTHPDRAESGAYFDGLWPGETYCFAVNSSDENGGNASPFPSINTPAKCEVAPVR